MAKAVEAHIHPRAATFAGARGGVTSVFVRGGRMSLYGGEAYLNELRNKGEQP